MNLKRLTDDVIRDEYVRRFTITGGERIKSSQDAADHFRGFFVEAGKQEQFVVLFLNAANAVLCTEVISNGTLTSAAVYPREVVRRVIALGAAAVVFAHNHPSGSVQVSQPDEQITAKLRDALHTIDVQVLDHIILGGDQYYSFADHGKL